MNNEHMNNQHMDVELFGKTYSVSMHDDTAPFLKEAIHYLEQKIATIEAAMANATPERIAMITALNLSYELILIKNPDTGWLENIHNSIMNMSKQIDAVLFAQEDLFACAV